MSFISNIELYRHITDFSELDNNKENIKGDNNKGDNNIYNSIEQITAIKNRIIEKFNKLNSDIKEFYNDNDINYAMPSIFDNFNHKAEIYNIEKISNMQILIHIEEFLQKMEYQFKSLRDFCNNFATINLKNELSSSIILSPNQKIILVEYKYGKKLCSIERFSDGNDKYISLFQPLLVTSFMEKSLFKNQKIIDSFKAFTLLECMIYDIYKIRYYFAPETIVMRRRKMVSFWLYIYYIHYLTLIINGEESSNLFGAERYLRTVLAKIIEFAETEPTENIESLKAAYNEYKNEANKILDSIKIN